MAVVSVNLLFDNRGGEHNWENVRTSTRVYEVIVDSTEDEEFEVANAVDPVTGVKIPGFGDDHPNITDCVACNIKADTGDDDPNIWYVTVEYSTDPGNERSQDLDSDGNTTPSDDKPGEASDNPLLRAAKWHISSIDRTEPLEEWIRILPNGDYNFIVPPVWVTGTPYQIYQYVSNGGNVYYSVQAGISGLVGPVGFGNNIAEGTMIWAFWGTLAQTQNDPRFMILEAVLNSGSVPFDPPHMVDVSIPTIVVTKNVPAFSLAYCLRMKNAVNLTPWKGVPRRCAKILKVEAGNATENGVAYVEVTWEIGLDPDTWDVQILDSGYGAIQTRTVPNPAPPPATVQKRLFMAFKDPSGEVISAPVPMNGKGGQLADGEQPVYLRGVPKQQKFAEFNDEIPW